MASITLKPKNVTAEMKARFKVRKTDPRVQKLRERFREEEDHDQHEKR